MAPLRSMNACLEASLKAPAAKKNTAGSLVSASLFYKKISDCIGISSVAGTFNGEAADYIQQVNRDGGHVQGIELIYQQTFTSLPAPWNVLGMAANCPYKR